MVLQPFERETTFGWDKSTHTCSLITFDQSLDRKLMKYCEQFPKHFKMVSEQIFDDIVEGHEFEFPKSLVTINKPRAKKQLTPEQKKAQAERMRKARESKKKVK